MSDFDKTNTGVLFKNDKGDNPKRPDYRGDININGEERWLSAWIKKSNDGTKTFMSLSIGELKEQQPPTGAGYAPPPADDFDDDTPF